MRPMNLGAQRSLDEAWRDVKGMFREAVEVKAQEAVKKALEDRMEAEVASFLRAVPYERCTGRRGYRSGVRVRTLVSQHGTLRLRVPKVREGSVPFSCLERYQRFTPEIRHLLMMAFLKGVSTRNVSELLKILAGETVSSSTVSRFAKTLDRQVRAFKRARIEPSYRFLVLDGIRFKLKTGIGSVAKRVLCAYGITAEGRRCLIAYRLVPSESERAWWGFLEDLRVRGLNLEALELVVTDGSTALHNALDTVFPDIPRQRCWAHKMRNVANKVPRRYQDPCLGQLRGVYDAPNKQTALARYRCWRNAWKTAAPKAVKCMEQDFDALFSFYRFPKELHPKLRTTNLIERMFLEVRRRTWPMGILSTVDSVDRIFYAIITTHNQKRDTPSEPFCTLIGT
jgi:putative transposase